MCAWADHSSGVDLTDFISTYKNTTYLLSSKLCVMEHIIEHTRVCG